MAGELGAVIDLLQIHSSDPQGHLHENTADTVGSTRS